MVNQALQVLLLQSGTHADLVFEQLKNVRSYITVRQQVDTVVMDENLLFSSNWDVIIAHYGSTKLYYEEILQILRGAKLEIPLILIADHIAAADAVRALKAGVSDIVFTSEIGRLHESINFEIQSAKSRQLQLQPVSSRHAEAILVGQNHVLELIVRGTPLPEVLNALALVIEQLSEFQKCSFLLLDASHNQPYDGAVIPNTYNQAMNGINVGISGCSCTMTGRTFESVAVEDIVQDPFKSQNLDFAQKYGGQYCWSLPILTKSGELLGMFAVYYDQPCTPNDADKQLIIKAVHLAAVAIELARTEDALRLTQAQFQQLAANIPGAMYQFLLSTDGSYKFPFVSPSCYEIYELTPFEIQQNPQKLFDIVRHQERLNLQISIQRSANKLEPWEWEGRIVTASGKEKWIKGAARPARQPNGDILWDGLVMDITESKRTQEALEQALHKLQHTQKQLIQTEKMSSLGQLVAGIAHEINNPVNFICNNINFASEYASNLLAILNLYQKYYPNPVKEIQQQAEAVELDFLKDDFPKILASMQTGTDRIDEIIQGLRCFSRIEETTAQNVNIHSIIDTVLLILHHRIKPNGHKPGINIIKQYSTLPLIKCYPGQLNQVFMNLIANAIDALEESFLVSLHKVPHLLDKLTIQISSYLSNDNSYVGIKISDNGPGIALEKQDQIFNAFFTTKPVGKGTGLGLAISKQIIVEKHNGKLECISQPGQGTEFVIEIPVGLDESY
ncbi:multi-sensor signal transduction histidine kinase [Calothrix sp. NIES-4071]|nr:multi-sensor signal transduction histidine kinase [Calothrix sp. NIES-4071]BAZ61450.1 multi-sensor signal transduction histidine kinase [Calothrix sp. NIES-4105]